MVCSFTTSLSFADTELNLSDAKVREDLYFQLLPQVKAVHDKGSYIYSGEELKQLKYDWKELSPSMIVVRHNIVDIIIFNKESNYYRTTKERKSI